MSIDGDFLQTIQQLTDNALISLSSDLTIISVNPAAISLFELPYEKIINQPLSFLTNQYKSLTNLFPKNFKKILEKTSFIETEKPLIQHNNKRKIISWRLGAIKNDANKLQGYLILGNDITNEKHAKYIDVTLENIIANVPVSIYWKDINGVYLGCNDYQIHMAGLNNREEFIDRTDYDFSWKKDAAKIQKTDQEIMRRGKVETVEEKGDLPDGKPIYLISNKVPMKDKEGHVVGILGISIDITERKLAEIELKKAKKQAEIANRAKNDFLASMSHDFRTPLNAILGLSEILSTDKHYRKQKEYFNDIIQAGNNLLHLVDDVLDFIKYEESTVKLHFESFNLQQLMKNVIGILKIEAHRKKLNLNFHYEKTIPNMLVSDPYKLSRIITNLLGNALKFTHHGDVSLSITPAKKHNNNLLVIFTIEDTGIGIPADKITTIFERFSRVDPSFKSPYKGTGLGLAITKRFVTAMKGSISVNSKVGKGTTFRCKLPLKIAERQDILPYWPKDMLDIKILIIDDFITHGSPILKEHSTNKTKYTTSKQALNNVTKAYKNGSSFHIVIIDDDMTSLKTNQISKKIKSDNRFKNILLLLLTKNCALKNLQDAEKNHFFGCLEKTIEEQSIAKQVISFWRKWKKKLRQKKATSHKKPNILLVEDDKLSQKAAKILIERLGTQIDIAESGQQVLEMWDRGYNLIFMDVGLGDIDGLTLTRMIRQQENKKSHIPIIALTAHVLEKEKKACLSAGMDDFLQKPLSSADIERILDQYVF